MIFTLTIYFLSNLISLLVGTIAGRYGWWGDSRMDKLQQIEAYLITELGALAGEQSSYGHFMVMKHMGRDYSEVCAELATTRTAIIQMGGTPLKLTEEQMKIIITNTTQPKK